MPIYTFLNTETGDIVQEMMSIAERDKYLKKNKHIQQQIVKAPALGDSIRMGLRKPDDAFRDRLREIKKTHSRGLTKSTINDF
jgi:hypothetical protein